MGDTSVNLAVNTEELLKRTTSRCPVCHASVPAEVWKVGDGNGGDFAAHCGDSARPNARVFLRRTCPEHGFAEACIASDARFYWLAQGDPQNQCCGGSCKAAEGDGVGTLGRNAAPEKIHCEGQKGHEGDEAGEQGEAASPSSSFVPLVPLVVKNLTTKDTKDTKDHKGRALENVWRRR